MRIVRRVLKQKSNMYLFAALTLAVPIFAPACAATSTRESTAGYIDNSAITAKVKYALLADSRMRGYDTNVETHKGTVQISGFVNSQDDVKHATQLVSAVEGVTSVHNNLIVKTRTGS